MRFTDDGCVDETSSEGLFRVLKQLWDALGEIKFDVLRASLKLLFVFVNERVALSSLVSFSQRLSLQFNVKSFFK